MGLAGLAAAFDEQRERLDKTVLEFDPPCEGDCTFGEGERVREVALVLFETPHAKHRDHDERGFRGTCRDGPNETQMLFALAHTSTNPRLGFERFVSKNAAFVRRSREAKHVMRHLGCTHAVVDGTRSCEGFEVRVHRAVRGIGGLEVAGDRDRLNTSVIRKERAVFRDAKVAVDAACGAHRCIGHVTQKRMPEVEFVPARVDHTARTKPRDRVVGEAALQQLEFPRENRSTGDCEPVNDAPFVGRKLRETQTKGLLKRRRKVVAVALVPAHEVGSASLVAFAFIVDKFEGTALRKRVNELKEEERIAPGAVEEIAAGFLNIRVDTEVARDDAHLVGAAKRAQDDGGKRLKNMAHATVGSPHEEHENARSLAAPKQVPEQVHAAVVDPVRAVDDHHEGAASRNHREQRARAEHELTTTCGRVVVDECLR